MRFHHLVHSKDGFGIRSFDAPAFTPLVEVVSDKLLSLTENFLLDPPGWSWDVPLGKPKWDMSSTDEPILENSLGNFLHDISQKIGSLPFRLERNNVDMMVHLTNEQANLLDPQQYNEMKWLEEPEDRTA